MTRSTKLALSAAVMAATTSWCGVAASAADGAPAGDTGTGSARETEPLAGTPVFPQGPAAAGGDDRNPLMRLMDEAGLGKGMDDLRLRLYGHVEGSYTYNF